MTYETRIASFLTTIEHGGKPDVQDGEKILNELSEQGFEVKSHSAHVSVGNTNVICVNTVILQRPIEE